MHGDTPPTRARRRLAVGSRPRFYSRGICTFSRRALVVAALLPSFLAAVAPIVDSKRTIRRSSCVKKVPQGGTWWQLHFFFRTRARASKRGVKRPKFTDTGCGLGHFLRYAGRCWATSICFSHCLGTHKKVGHCCRPNSIGPLVLLLDNYRYMTTSPVQNAVFRPFSSPIDDK